MRESHRCRSSCLDRQDGAEWEGAYQLTAGQTHTVVGAHSDECVLPDGEVVLEGRRARRAEGPWRGRDQRPLRDGSRSMGSPCTGGPCSTGGGVRGEHTDTDGDGDAGAGVGPRPTAGEQRGRAPLAPPVEAWGMSRPPSHFSMPTPSVASCPPDRPLPGSGLRVPSDRGSDADPGVQGKACPELVEGPPHLHRRADEPEPRLPFPIRYLIVFYGVRTVLYRPAPVLSTVLDASAVPLPFIQGQRLSVGLFPCGILRACGVYGGLC